ncbi:MAG: hypothetical protein ACR2PA_17210, partial [Hyphomicrobiaceae bacterium]
MKDTFGEVYACADNDGVVDNGERHQFGPEHLSDNEKFAADDLDYSTDDCDEALAAAVHFCSQSNNVGRYIIDVRSASTGREAMACVKKRLRGRYDYDRHFRVDVSWRRRIAPEHAQLFWYCRVSRRDRQRWLWKRQQPRLVTSKHYCRGHPHRDCPKRMPERSSKPTCWELLHTERGRARLGAKFADLPYIRVSQADADCEMRLAESGTRVHFEEVKFVGYAFCGVEVFALNRNAFAGRSGNLGYSISNQQVDELWAKRGYVAGLAWVYRNRSPIFISKWYYDNLKDWRTFQVIVHECGHIAGADETRADCYGIDILARKDLRLATDFFETFNRFFSRLCNLDRRRGR